MRPAVHQTNRVTSSGRSKPLSVRVVTTVVAAVAMLIASFVAIQGSLGRASQVQAAEPGAGDHSGPVTTSSTTTAPSTTTSTSTTTTTTAPTTTTTYGAPSPAPPAPEARYVVPPTEAEPEAKQLAADIAYALTTYGASEDHVERLSALASGSGIDLQAQADGLIYPGAWSQGQVIYPQLGGLRNGRASVMVVTRQTVGSDGEVDFTVVRTLDIRLVLGESGWEFDFLSSAGGTFDRLEDLALAHSVARDPRIQMPDSARLDILAGLVSPVLLSLMADIADQTPYSVTVLVTGHPENVFETDRISDHTVGRAIDIIRVGDRPVIDDRGEGSATHALVEWLYNRTDVRQVGSPWDLDGPSERRSFVDTVHQDHIHIAIEIP